MSMVRVTIVGLQLNPDAASVVVLAESTDADRVLPIFIGPAEAQAIATAVAGVELPRPMTHDLMVTLLGALDSRLEEVAVTELVDGTFHAELFVESPDGLVNVSARPSDAIALAVRTDVPVFVHADVLAEAAVVIDRDVSEPLSDEQIDAVVHEFQQLLERVTPADFTDPSSEPDTDTGSEPEPG